MSETSGAHFIPNDERKEPVDETAKVEERYKNLFSDKADWEHITATANPLQEVHASLMKWRHRDAMYGRVDKRRKKGEDFLTRVSVPAYREGLKALLGYEKVELSDEYLPKPVVKSKLGEGERMGAVCKVTIRPGQDEQGETYELDIVGVTDEKGDPAALLFYSGEKKSQGGEYRYRRDDPVATRDLVSVPVPEEIPHK